MIQLNKRGEGIMLMKRKSLIFMMVLALLSVLVYPQSWAQSIEEMSIEEIEAVERNSAFTFLRDVIGIDIEAYNMSYKFVTDRNSRPELKVFPKHATDAILLLLKEENNVMEISVEFVDGMLEWFWVLDCQGKPKMRFQHSSDLINDARIFLERYEKVFNASYCSKMLPFLKEITTLENSTVEKNGLAFKVCVDIEDNYIGFSWRHVVNGLKSPSIFSFSISTKDGLLLHFYDGWNLWKIGSSEIKVSRDEAINIALKVAESYIEGLGAKVVKITATLDLYNDEITERGGDLFILFPRWFIELYFDKTYGNGDKITGYDVCVWADTGEAFWHGPEAFYSSNPELIQNPVGEPNIDIWTIAALIIATLIITLLATPIIAEKRAKNH